jgi:hypothetical protein
VKRSEVRRRLGLAWWRHLALCLAPLLAISFGFGRSQPLLPVLGMPIFIAGLAALFVSLPLFNAYKRALMALAAALGSEAEPAAWIELANRQRLGFVGAGLPAWIGACGVFFGLDAVGLVLLALASATVMLLYRLPRQLQ